jgi:Helix-turn-helix domain
MAGLSPGHAITSAEDPLGRFGVTAHRVRVDGPPRGEVAMRDREPTVRSRELGEGLRRAMEDAGLNGKQAAHVLGWSPSWVSRLLSGKRGGHRRVPRLMPGQEPRAGPAARALPGAAHPGLAPAARFPVPKQLVTLIDHENKGDDR